MALVSDGPSWARARRVWFPDALAIVPGLGLVVADRSNYRLQVFATPDVIAMWTNMSGFRVAWMTAAARGIMYCFANRKH